MTNPTDTANAFAKLREAIAKGDAQLVTLDGKPAKLPEGYRPHDVNARNYKGVWEIQNANEAAGLYWFKPDAMRFFRTKVGRYFGAGVFTTRETNPMGKTAHSIRVADTEGNVQTFGEFHTFAHGKTSTAAAQRLAALLTEGQTVIDSKGQTFTLAR
ncbi:hypothetical protein UFOVP1533_41 [uncultured Caudovirales phage]|uniref:Uncharacterized protein n=1 Tax=uncultured Caudovirales phage TaxID=2100421 RepID=A0A6J7XDX8_9CAUD|nr:hypothetical protein UFOVP1086_41 [uncultured Caudovirales phage]CAB4212904.1 hypothetical protein UFOVP1440_41 [uncultured Caudovirales phage]CAB5228331.1 hypothetical protein UFOVP1533_41 [uncultured Caudovirales phage]